MLVKLRKISYALFLEMPTLSGMRGAGSRNACKFTWDLGQPAASGPSPLVAGDKTNRTVIHTQNLRFL